MPALAPAHARQELETSQRYLNSARDSVNSLLRFFAESRKSRGVAQGTTTEAERDLLRASIVFAGAGLDAVLKQLIRDALPALVHKGVVDAEEGLLRFTQRLVADPKQNAAALLADDSKQYLMDNYIYELTGSSLQSREQVKAVASALGIHDRALASEIDGLGELFEARNQISHELDLQDVKRHGIKKRRSRDRPQTAELTDKAFAVGQLFIDRVDGLL